MAEYMKQYIQEQFSCWERILGGPLAADVRAEGIISAGRYRHLMIVGSGSSFIAGLIARDFGQKLCGLHTIVLTPSQLEGEIPFYRGEDTLAVAVSQSGKSVTTMEALNLLEKNGISTLTMTSDEESEIGKRGAGHIRIDCGPEVVGPKTKGMTATVLTLYLLLLRLQKGEGEREKVMENLYQAVRYGKENARRAEVFAAAHEDFLKNAPSVLILSGQEALGSIREGALKILETWYVPAEALELEEYTHGVQNTISVNQHHILVSMDSCYGERMKNLDAFQREKGCVNLRITVEEEEGDRVLSILSTGTHETIFMELLPVFHILSALGSEYRGIDCDKPKFANFYGLMGTKI